MRLWRRRWGALEREKKFKFYRGTPTLGPYAGSRARNMQHFSSSVCTGNSERNEPPNSGSNSTNVARFNGGRNGGGLKRTELMRQALSMRLACEFVPRFRSKVLFASLAAVVP